MVFLHALMAFGTLILILSLSAFPILQIFFISISQVEPGGVEWIVTFPSELVKAFVV